MDVKLQNHAVEAGSAMPSFRDIAPREGVRVDSRTGGVPSRAGGAWRAENLRAAILLGGTVRASGFGSSIKRSLLDLPIGGGTTLLGYWGSEVLDLCDRLGAKNA